MRRKEGQLVAEDDIRAMKPSPNSRTSRREGKQPYASEVEDYAGETTAPPRADKKRPGNAAEN